MMGSMMRRAMIGDGSTLSLDFTTGVLDSRLTFTRSTTGTYINSSGYVTSAAINAPRFDYDPVTLAQRGLLIEASASNLLFYSQDVTQASKWTIQTAYASISTTGGTAPDNTNTGNLCTESTGSAARSIYQAISPAAGTYTASLWAKAGSGSARFIRLVLSSAAGNFVYVTVNIATGAITQSATAVGTATAASATVTGHTGSWYRITLTGTLAAAANFIFIVPTDSGTASVNTSDYGRYTYTGDGSSFLIWGVQVEAGSGASSYIPTGASTGNRAADFAVLSDLSAIGFNTAGGSMVVRGYQTKLSSGSYAALAAFLDSGDVDVFGIRNDVAGTVMFGRFAGTSTSAEATRTITNNAAYAFGMSADPTITTGAITVSMNGSSTTGNKSGSATAISTPTKFAITRPGYGAFINCGTIRSIKYWPTVKTAAELNSLTT